MPGVSRPMNSSFTLVAGVLLLITTSAVACPLEKGRYRYTNSDNYSDGRFFTRNGSDGTAPRQTYFRMTIATTPSSATTRDGVDIKRPATRIKMAFALSGDGSQEIRLARQDDDAGRIDWVERDAWFNLLTSLFLWNKAHQPLTKVPARNDAAPGFVFLPHMNAAFRYVGGASVGFGMFELVSCAK
jgi:hypothetical protein